MGGNLFKLGRIPAARYRQIEAGLREYLDGKLGAHYRIPRYYGDKADFGDVDILVSEAACPPGDWVRLREEIAAELGITETMTRGHVFSTVYQGFQVDFFTLPEDSFEMTYHFMSYNILGNILGRIFRRFDLKYGEQGLCYVYRRAAGNYKRDLLVSRDIEAILSFLELDAAPWRRGFDRLEELFAWVITSPYFSVKPFLRPEGTMRKRMEERPAMRRFRDWLQEQGVTQCFEPEDRAAYLPEIDAHFSQSGLLDAIEAERRLEERALALEAKFSGRLVMGWLPQLRGKALGMFIKHFRERYPDARLQEMAAEDIERAVRGFWEERGDRGG